MSNRIPLLTVAVSFAMLAAVIFWVGTRDQSAPTPAQAKTANAAPAARGDTTESATKSEDVAVSGNAASERSEPLPGAAQPGAASAADDFAPPTRSEIPDDEFGAMVRKGRDIFTDTQQHADQFVGNDLQCANCHLDEGRRPDSAPLWAAWAMYPAYRGKNKHVNDFAERIQGCFRYSMNGTPPPRGDEVLVALESYAYWLASGAPVAKDLAGRGYPELEAPEQPPSFTRGKQVFADHCALCHGRDGQGQRAADGSLAFPPLWGPRSYNWGAGMHRVNTAAGFIKANMPLGAATLSDQQAWDVARFIDSQERPQDPRFTGSVSETAEQYHGEHSMYGQTVNGVVLGQDAPPSGTAAKVNQP